jgi:hypothetical protein
MKKTFLSLGFAACAALTLTLATGCASDPNKHTARVIGGAGKVLKAGIGENPITGLYELQLADGDAAAMVVPLIYRADTNSPSGLTVIVPDAVLSAEYGGKATFFGSGSSTYTIAVGPNAVNTLLGGMHVPINSPYWTNSAVGLSQSLPLGSPTTISAAGSTISSQTPITATITTNGVTIAPK